jgi:hypothetical protein
MNRLLSQLFRRQSPIRNTRTRLGIEQLDRRDLPSATAAFDTGTGVLTVTGDGANDNVTVTESLAYNNGNPTISITGVTSSTTNGASNGGVIYSQYLKSLNVNLGAGDDTFKLTRASFLMKPATPFMVSVSNPYYNRLTSGTINGGDGNDTIDMSGANPGAFTLAGGNGNDYLYGSPGNDLLLGGAGDDYEYGNAGNDAIGSGYLNGMYVDDSGSNYLHGGDGSDSILGGSGTNHMWGEAGDDTLRANGSGHNELYGGDGTDTLYGYGNGNSFLDAGSAGEYAYTANKDYNAYMPVINGAKYTDIVQGGGGTCWILASLASATYRNIDLGAKIQYEGDGVYRVSWNEADANGNWSEELTFNGSLYNADPRPQNGEFWTVLYQRAVLESFNDSLSSPPSGNPVSVMPLLTGRAANWYNGISVTDLTNDLNAGKLVAVTTNSSSTGEVVTTPNIVPGHCYMVEAVHVTAWKTVYKNGEDFTYATDWAVDMYNPWGYNVTVSWNDYCTSVHDTDVG